MIFQFYMIVTAFNLPYSHVNSFSWICLGKYFPNYETLFSLRRKKVFVTYMYSITGIYLASKTVSNPYFSTICAILCTLPFLRILMKTSNAELPSVIDFLVWYQIKSRHKRTWLPASACMGCALNPERMRTEPCLNRKATLTGRLMASDNSTKMSYFCPIFVDPQLFGSFIVFVAISS